ncbi:hypothetical protein TTHERM_00209360 (macronuclear) [Tetrahymena thermophila SB210]|uniref:Transmembrane protein n=1 Tax=Tetrahymena thermophila (strain SB210) TaxID=312017 RepID=Q22NA3_TETTS|nr:hypothetical protein TTHERM_00209360 [Tetrahymena thermophila SB210]EAR86882.1 hypothetical protein TTHERM_00209360 [Tetrahymena thermophila SB210]|eukprot:XP_001007127.1 hypothetical protein TTHERM_00209360 [Tetrahymena thermophila SB210]
MKYLLTITFLVTLSCFCMCEQKDCSLNLSCNSSDNTCQNELSQFQSCVSSKCDSQKIQSQDVWEIFDCYYIHCKPSYQPLLSEIMNVFSCLNLSISESEHVDEESEDEEIDLEQLKENLNKSSEGKCLAQMISDCQASSNECVASFYIQLQCMSSQCNLEEEPTINEINKCIQNTCQSSFDQLKQLNNKFSQCLQQLDQTSSSYLISITISFFLILLIL